MADVLPTLGAASGPGSVAASGQAGVATALKGTGKGGGGGGGSSSKDMRSTATANATNQRNAKRQKMNER